MSISWNKSYYSLLLCKILKCEYRITNAGGKEKVLAMWRGNQEYNAPTDCCSSLLQRHHTAPEKGTIPGAQLCSTRQLFPSHVKSILILVLQRAAFRLAQEISAVQPQKVSHFRFMISSAHWTYRTENWKELLPTRMQKPHRAVANGGWNPLLQPQAAQGTPLSMLTDAVPVCAQGALVLETKTCLHSA